MAALRLRRVLTDRRPLDLDEDVDGLASLLARDPLAAVAREERGERVDVLVEAERTAVRENAAQAQRGHPQLLAADGVREEALLRRGEQRVEARGRVRVAGEAEDLAGRERTMLNAEC